MPAAFILINNMQNWYRAYRYYAFYITCHHHYFTFKQKLSTHVHTIFTTQRPASFLIVPPNMKYVTYTVDLSLKVKSRQMEEKARTARRRRRSGRRRRGEGKRKRRYAREDGRGGVSYRSSRNLRATIRVVPVSTAWIRNESNGFDALRDHE